jgi:hypothetical protein
MLKMGSERYGRKTRKGSEPGELFLDGLIRTKEEGGAGDDANNIPSEARVEALELDRGDGGSGLETGLNGVKRVESGLDGGASDSTAEHVAKQVTDGHAPTRLL